MPHLNGQYMTEDDHMNRMKSLLQGAGALANAGFNRATQPDRNSINNIVQGAKAAGAGIAAGIAPAMAQKPSNPNIGIGGRATFGSLMNK